MGVADGFVAGVRVVSKIRVWLEARVKLGVRG